MKKKKININNIENDDVKLIKKLIIILLVVVIVVVGFYFLTDKVVKPAEEEKMTVEVNYEVATVGTILNRPYDEYFVLLYDSTDVEATYYSTLLSNFKSSSDEKIYYVDLSLKENSKYVGEKSNKDLTSASDATFAGPTLLKIKNGKVVSYLENRDEIKVAMN